MASSIERTRVASSDPLFRSSGFPHAVLLTGCAPTAARTGQPATVHTATPSAKLPPSQPLPDSEIRAILAAFAPQFAELELRPERAWERVYAVQGPLDVQATLQALAQWRCTTTANGGIRAWGT